MASVAPCTGWYPRNTASQSVASPAFSRGSLGRGARSRFHSRHTAAAGARVRDPIGRPDKKVTPAPAAPRSYPMVLLLLLARSSTARPSPGPPLAVSVSGARSESFRTLPPRDVGTLRRPRLRATTDGRRRRAAATGVRVCVCVCVRARGLACMRVHSRANSSLGRVGGERVRGITGKEKNFNRNTRAAVRSLSFFCRFVFVHG